jgi:hypothetical protein
MAADVYYSAEFVVSFEKLKKGVVESQASLEKLEGEIKKSGDKAGKDLFGEVGKEADKAKNKIDGLGKAVKKSNADNTKSTETFFSAFKKGWKNSTDVAGGQAVKLGKLIGGLASPVSLLTAATVTAFAFIANKAKEAYNNWKTHNENVLKAKNLYELLNHTIGVSADRDLELLSAENKVRAAQKVRIDEAERKFGPNSLVARGIASQTEELVEQAKAQIRRTQAEKYAADALNSAAKAQSVYTKETIALEREEKDIDLSALETAQRRRDIEYTRYTALIETQALLDRSNASEEKAWQQIEYFIRESGIALDIFNEALKKRKEEEEKETKELTRQEKIDKARAAAEERYHETIAKVNAERNAGILTEQAADDARNSAMAAWKDALQGIVDEYDLAKGYTVNLLNEKRAIVGETETQKRLEEENRKLAEASKQLADDTVEINDQIIKQKIDQKRAEAEIADTDEKRNDLLDEALQLEIDLLLAQRKREKERYQATKEYKTAMEENRSLVEMWEIAFDKATDGMVADLKKVEKEVDNLSAMGFSTNRSKAQEWADELAGYINQAVSVYQDAASSVLSITQIMAQDQITVIENLLEQQQELIDAQYEDTMKRLEEERQAALEAAGFVAAITEEGLEAAMAAAIGSGDEAVIYREKRRQEELAINKQYDKLEKDAEKQKNDDLKAAEEKAAREIAEIEYRQAMADWAIKLAMAPAQIAVAILQGYSQLGPIGGSAGAIIMGVVGALQTAALIAAMPKKPALAGGGIIGLPQTYSGEYANGGIVEANTPRGVDAVDITAANREMILNDDQQANLFQMIAAGQTGGGTITIVVQSVLDGEIVSENTVRHINDGVTSPINARMIQ